MMWLAALGMSGVGVLLLVLALLSRRLGGVTRASAYYIGLYIAALLFFVSAGVRLWHWFNPPSTPIDLTSDVIWILLYHGAPALGLTLGVVVAWRYWSWLLAERG